MTHLVSTEIPKCRKITFFRFFKILTENALGSPLTEETEKGYENFDFYRMEDACDDNVVVSFQKPNPSVSPPESIKSIARLIWCLQSSQSAGKTHFHVCECVLKLVISCPRELNRAGKCDFLMSSGKCKKVQ